ncbi:MAG: TolC family protein [Candidatus Korobacteraceae bacterium]|jgi:outer membrane protein TolC
MSKIIFHKIQITILLTGFLVSALVAQQPKLTLQQAVAAALEHNPAQKLAVAEIAASEAGFRLSKAPLLPQIQFSEKLTRGDDPVYAFGTKLRQQVFQASDFGLGSLNRPSPLGDFTTTFSGRWVAFDSLHTQFQIKRASLLKQGSAASAGRTGQEVIYRVVEAYESVLIATREVEVATHAVETAQALYGQSRTRVDAGLVVESDALSAQVNLAARQQELIQAQGAEQTAWSELEAAVGVALPQGPEGLDQLAEHRFSTSTLVDEVDQAFKSRSDLKSLALQTTAQQTAVKSARTEFGPRVDAFGSWQTDRQSFAGSGGSNWMAGVELRMDLLPVEKQFRLQQEKASLLRAQAGEESARSMIRVEVSRAFFGHQSAMKMVEVARDSMTQARESLRILRNRYDAGLVPLTDVLRAEDAERQSQSGYWQAVYRNALSYAALRLATGTLNAEQVVSFQ